MDVVNELHLPDPVEHFEHDPDVCCTRCAKRITQCTCPDLPLADSWWDVQQGIFNRWAEVGAAYARLLGLL